MLCTSPWERDVEPPLYVNPDPVPSLAQDGQDIIVAVGAAEDRPRPQIAFTGPLFEGGRGPAEGAAAFGDAPQETAEARSVLAVEICDETGCTVQYQAAEPRASQVCLCAEFVLNPHPDIH